MTTRSIAPALLEMRAAINEAEALTVKSDITKRDEARISVLLAKIAALRSGNVGPSDFAQRWMAAFVRGTDLPVEARTNTDLLAGKQSIVYTQGALGGYLVPQEIHDALIFGLAQWDPFLDADLVTLSESNGFTLKPYTVPGWDLSTFQAVKVAENAQQTPQTIPTATGTILNSYTYRATLDASFEFEDDDFQPTMQQIIAAYAIAFARGIGVDLAIGNGTTAPQGILTGAGNSGVTLASHTSITATDIENVYFSVNRIYRNAPKCAWAMSDAVYELVRKAVDNNGRPLINVVDDKEMLMGKPVYVSPSLPTGSASKGIVFGDFSHYVVRVSRMEVTRNLQAPGYVDAAKGLYTGRMRADAKVVDPTNGGTPPIVYATLV